MSAQLLAQAPNRWRVDQGWYREVAAKAVGQLARRQPSLGWLFGLRSDLLGQPGHGGLVEDCLDGDVDAQFSPDAGRQPHRQQRIAAQVEK